MSNFLKKIELLGFKSFANKTVLDFPLKVTAIVGPNGSGKSNVMDAFKWVLGEREAKQLRGEKLENLIFAGTPKKSPAGLAKVSLVFDNQKKIFPLDLNEVVLTRKIDRSGVSEFFLNDEIIKLKDLNFYLAKAKIGTRGLMMISQGDSDIFVKSSNLERRLYIEEILGLREFRLKKNQAKNQLIASLNNLEKLKAALNEILPHLKFLRKQKNKWEKRREIEDELKDIEDKYFGFKFHHLKQKLNELEPKLKVLETELRKQNLEIEKEEKKLEEINQNYFQKNVDLTFKNKINEVLEKRSKLEKELGKIEFRIDLLKEASLNLNQEEVKKIFLDLLKDLETVLKSEDLIFIKDKLNFWLKKINEILKTNQAENKEILLKEQKEILSQLETVQKEYELLLKKEDEYYQKQKDYNLEFKNLFEVLEEKRKRFFVLEKEKDNLLFEKEKILSKINELKIQFESFNRHSQDLEKIPYFDLAEDVLRDYERKILRLRNELGLIGEIDEGMIKEAEETESRYQTLEKEVVDLQKAIADLKILIKDLDHKINQDFLTAFHKINEEFNNYFKLMFNGGKAAFKLEKKIFDKNNTDLKEEEEANQLKEEKENDFEDKIEGVEIEINIPKKKIKNLEMLSGGEKSLVSIAALFALISVSPPPFLILDEIDAALDEANAYRFANLISQFSAKTQFIIITHNRVTMEIADILYGVTMGDDGVSQVYSLKLENVK